MRDLAQSFMKDLGLEKEKRAADLCCDSSRLIYSSSVERASVSRH